MKNNKKGIYVLIVVLVGMIFFLLGFIAERKLDQENKNSEVETIKKEKIEDNNKKNNVSKSESESKKITEFNQKNLVINLKNKNIKFEQSVNGDMNAGLQFIFSDYDVYCNVDTNTYYNVVSIGSIEKNNSIFVLALMSNESNDLRVFYADIDKEKINTLTSEKMAMEIMSSFKELNTNISIKSIGTTIKDNVNYASVSSENNIYLIDENNNLIEYR